MKRMILLLCALLCLTACDRDERLAKDRQMLLVYFAGNNSLAAEGASDYNSIKQNWLPTTRGSEKVMLVFHHFKDETPVLVRLSKDRRGNTVEDIIKEYPFNTHSADARTLETVLADAEAAWPSAHHGIVLWSHGSGFLPPGYYINPQERAKGDPVSEEADPYAFLVKAGGDGLKSFAQDEEQNIEMDLIDLRKALSRFHYDFIAFDCCLMANVELAYELRNTSDYLIFSPTEIMSDGFPYDVMVQTIFSQQPEAAMRSIAQSYMAHYRSFSGVYASATISVVRTAGMQALANACQTVFRNHQDQILMLDRSHVQPYFRYNKHWFYDIDDFVQQVADDSEYQAFNRALNQAVIYRDATDYFLDLEISHYSGLSIYIPRREYTVLNNYYKTLAWNQATGLVQ
ncbi:MAG: hypothetical protein IJQ69_01470 [Bacteroidales bacterium]|nr:hypothetical protein [Bacteroidales bacterium]